jgi:hypothetical protein
MAIRGLLLVVLGLLLGCGHSSDLQRIVVSGKITYQGKPLRDGLISFVPIKGTKGPTASATITDGAYSVSAAGGVPAGDQRVEIQAFRPLPANNSPNRPPLLLGGEPREQYLPARCNAKSTLETTIEAKGSQTRDFDLK